MYILVISRASDVTDEIRQKVQQPFVPTVVREGRLLLALQLPREGDVQQEEVTVATALAVEGEGLVQPKVGRVDPEGSGNPATNLLRSQSPG